jgi:hypothetical protein
VISMSCEERVSPCIRSRTAIANSDIPIPYGYRGENCVDICPNPISIINVGRLEHRFTIRACVCGCLESEIFHYGSGSYFYMNINENTLNIDCSLNVSIPLSVSNATSVSTIELVYGNCRELPIVDFTDREVCANTNAIFPDPRLRADCRVTIDTIGFASSLFTFTIFHDPSNITRSNLSAIIYQFFEVARGFGYIHLQIVTIISFFNACVKEFTSIFDPTIANTKEDQEVLKGLWIGNYAYQEHHDTHIIKHAKVVDLI